MKKTSDQIMKQVRVDNALLCITTRTIFFKKGNCSGILMEDLKKVNHISWFLNSTHSINRPIPTMILAYPGILYKPTLALYNSRQ